MKSKRSVSRRKNTGDPGTYYAHGYRSGFVVSKIIEISAEAERNFIAQLQSASTSTLLSMLRDRRRSLQTREREDHLIRHELDKRFPGWEINHE